MANSWRFLPTDILGEQRREEQANAWGQQQRSQLANDWATNAHQQTANWLEELRQRFTPIEQPLSEYEANRQYQTQGVAQPAPEPSLQEEQRLLRQPRPSAAEPPPAVPVTPDTVNAASLAVPQQAEQGLSAVSPVYRDIKQNLGENLGNLGETMNRYGNTVGETVYGAGLRGETRAPYGTPGGIAESLLRGAGRLTGETLQQGPGQAVEQAIAREAATPEPIQGLKGGIQMLADPFNAIGLGEARAVGKGAVELAGRGARAGVRGAEKAVDVAGDVARSPLARDFVQGTAGSVPDVTRGAEAAAPSKRFYHGTGSAFDKPEAGKFDAKGLYGPGYYVTDKPEIASSYANIARSEQAAPNIRPVDLPVDLHLLDVQRPVAPADVERVAQALNSPETAGARTVFNRMRFNRPQDAPLYGEDLYRTLADSALTPTQVNSTLSRAGFDGVQHPGGTRTPLLDQTGKEIQHNAVVIFGQSLPKVRNALSGAQGGAVNPMLALHAGSSVAGGLTGYAAAPEDQKVQGALAGAAIGAVAPTVVRQGGRALGEAAAKEVLQPGGATKALLGRSSTAFAPEWYAKAEQKYIEADNAVQRLAGAVQEAQGLADYAPTASIMRPPESFRLTGGQRATVSTVGLSDAQLREVARRSGKDATQRDWWNATDSVDWQEVKTDWNPTGMATTPTAPTKSGIKSLEQKLDAALSERQAAEAEMNAALDAPEGTLGPQRPTATLDLPDLPLASQTTPTQAVEGGHASSPLVASTPIVPLKIAHPSEKAAAVAVAEKAVPARTLPNGIAPVPGVPAPKPVPGAKPIELTREEEIARLRLDKFPAEMHDALTKGAERVDFAREQRRGVVPDQAAEDAADKINRTVEQWIKQGKAGKAYNTEETRALRNAIVAQAENADAISRQVVEAQGKGEATDLLIGRAFAEGEKLSALQTVAEGARAEWGRAGRAYQIATRSFSASPAEALQRIYTKVGGRDNALQAVLEFNNLRQQGANPVQMAQFWARVEKPPVKTEDWFRALRYNSMLSGPRTFEINLIGNSLEVPWRLVRDTGASLARGNPKELKPELAGMWAGLQKGGNAALEVLQQGITTEQALRGDLPRDMASRLTGGKKTVALALEGVNRGMQAADEMARQTAYGMGLGRFAGQMASREGKKGADWTARVAEIMAKPPQGVVTNALNVADRMTYHNDMGSLGNALAGVQRVPFLGNIILPFLKTVYNITARGIDRSPLGLVGTGIDVARGVYKGGKALPKGVAPVGERLGDNVMGTIAAMPFLAYAAGGNVSGAGPDDAQKKDLLRAQGWQPYSIKIGDNWVSYSNWGPVSILLSECAAVAESAQYAKPDAGATGIIWDAFRRFGELATEQVYLQGVGNVYKAISDPERYSGQWLTGFFQTLIPYGSAINTVGQATDTVSRSPERFNVPQAMAARLPGLRESVPATQDILGRDVPNQYQGTAAVQPLRSSTAKSDPTLAELTRLGVDISRAPTTWQNVPLSQQQQRAFQQQAGPLINRLVERALANPTYAKMGDVEKAKALDGAIGKVRLAIGDAIVKQMMAERLRQRRSTVGAAP